MTPTAHHDDHKRDRREALRPSKSRLKIKTTRPTPSQPLPTRPKVGGRKVTERASKAWPIIAAAPYALSVSEYQTELGISNWLVAQMRLVCRYFEEVGVEPTGDWTTDRHFAASPATPSGTPSIRTPAFDLFDHSRMISGSDDPVFTELLDTARKLAAEVKAARKHAETLRSRSARARRLVIDYAMLHSINLTVPPSAP